MNYVTTLIDIWNHNPCDLGWCRLLKHLGKTRPDNELVPLSVILDSNGLNDALWSLRAVQDVDRDARLYAVWCARQVKRLFTHHYSGQAVKMAEGFARGDVIGFAMRVANSLALSVTASSDTSYELAPIEKARLVAASVAAHASQECARTAAAYTSSYARVAMAEWDPQQLGYDGAYQAAKASHIEKFREMFCTDGSIESSIQELPTWML